MSERLIENIIKVIEIEGSRGNKKIEFILNEIKDTSSFDVLALKLLERIPNISIVLKYDFSLTIISV